MALKPYSKPPLTIDEQVDQLKHRGMVIENEENAKFRLRQLSYYRMVAYWLPFESDHNSHSFVEGTSFERIVDYYEFDRELRLLFLDAIERVEISVRSAWAYEMAHAHGSHAHLDAALTRNVVHAKKNVDDLYSELERSHELFIPHYRATYSDPTPPIWVVSEVMSLGLLSRFYKNHSVGATRKLIAHRFGIGDVVLQSWLHQLTLIRNTCAHHSRLWNRSLQVSAMVPTRHMAPLSGTMIESSFKLYNAIIAVVLLMDSIDPGNSWIRRFDELVVRYRPSTEDMGFPIGWRDMLPWTKVLA